MNQNPYAINSDAPTDTLPAIVGEGRRTYSFRYVVITGVVCLFIGIALTMTWFTIGLMFMLAAEGQR